jgi:hypothetical protein
MIAEKRPLKILGKYTATDLQLAMRVVLARAHLRALRLCSGQAQRTTSPLGCDVRADGRLIQL